MNRKLGPRAAVDTQEHQASRRRMVSCWAIAVFASLTLSTASAQPAGDFAAQICNSAGVCAPVDPATALLIAGIKALGDEINKGEKGFGPNGAVIKAVNTVLGDLERGKLGPNNDLVRAFETIKNDLTKGPGKNNDIVKFFKGIGIVIK